MQLRGANLGLNKTHDDIALLFTHGANSVRWQLFTGDDTSKWTFANYILWIETNLTELQNALPVFPAGTKIVVALMTPWGGANFTKLQKGISNFTATWVYIAQRLKDIEQVWGYDMVNEPSASNDVLSTIQYNTARAIRRSNREKNCIATFMHSSYDQLAKSKPISGIDYYTFNMYFSMNYTHQGLENRKDHILYTQGQATTALDRVNNWATRYKKKIYVGEFSAVKWADKGSAWLHEVSSYLNKVGWDWAYHAWREAWMWDLELPPDRTTMDGNLRTRTFRLEVMEDAWRNR